MSEPTAVSATFDALVQWAMTPDRQADVVAARAEYSELAGEVFEEDRQLEVRLAGFLEFYLCDRVAPWCQSTPARARYLEALRSEAAPEASRWRRFTETWHGLFRVEGLEAGAVKLESLFSKGHVAVLERRTLHGLSMGDVLEARLIPHEQGVVFSSAWVWHAHEAAPAILAEAERRRVAGQSERDFLFDCARRSLKADRYRQIAIEKIYDFSTR